MTLRDKHYYGIMEGYRLQFENGNKEALLTAVDLCAKWQIVMPDWVAIEFSKAYRKWAEYEVRTLDKAFELQEARKNVKISAKKQFFDNAGDIFMDVNNLDSITAEKVEEIGEKYGFSYKKTWDMYNHIKNNTQIGKGFNKVRKYLKEAKRKQL